MDYIFIFSYILWHILGVFLLIHIWTQDLDLEIRDLFVMVILGFIGPIAYLLYLLGSSNMLKKVLIKKRK